MYVHHVLNIILYVMNLRLYKSINYKLMYFMYCFVLNDF